MRDDSSRSIRGTTPAFGRSGWVGGGVESGQFDEGFEYPEGVGTNGMNPLFRQSLPRTWPDRPVESSHMDLSLSPSMATGSRQSLPGRLVRTKPTTSAPEYPPLPLRCFSAADSIVASAVPVRRNRWSRPLAFRQPSLSATRVDPASTRHLALRSDEDHIHRRYSLSRPLIAYAP